MQRISKFTEKYGFNTVEVSAKNWDKVYESIKDFGIGIAKAKMEKMGISWFVTGGSSNLSSSQPISSSSPPKTESQKASEPTKVSPVPVARQPETIKISSKKNVVPSYQKKCC